LIFVKNHQPTLFFPRRVQIPGKLSETVFKRLCGLKFDLNQVFPPVTDGA
jgi:hypothetical protein